MNTDKKTTPGIRQNWPPPLLNYQVSTVPTTMVAGKYARTQINISANPGVLCTNFLLAVPTGDLADELYSFVTTPKVTVISSNWANTSSYPSTAADLGYDGDMAYTVFPIRNLTPNNEVSADFLVVIEGTVNALAGVAMLDVRELAHTDNTSINQLGVKRFSMTKTSTADSSEFYLRNLASYNPDVSNIPITEFAGGSPINLTWDSNGTYFKVYCKNNPDPIAEGTNPSASINRSLFTDSTVVVEATLDDLVLYDSITITISNPNLTPASVNTAGDEMINGNLTVSGNSTLNNTNMSGSLSVNDGSQFSGVSAQSINVSGQTTLGNANIGGLTVNQGTSLNGTTVNGSLNVSQGATVGSATINNGLTVNGSSSVGALTVNGALTSYGTVSIFNSGSLVASGTNLSQTGVYAKTDGIVLINIGTPGNSSPSSFAIGSVYTSQNWFSLLGGTVGAFGSGWSKVMMVNPNTCTVPVPAGTTWWYSGYNDGANQADSTIYIYWFPLGGSNSQERTYEIIQEGTHKNIPPPPKFSVADLKAERMKKAAGIVSLLERAADKTFDADVKEELATRLLTL